MKKLLIVWISPFIIALCTVGLLRFFVFDVAEVRFNNMANSFKPGDKLVYSKIKSFSRNTIALIANFPDKKKEAISRIIALPGDTVVLSNSLVYVNNQRITDDPKTIHPYIFKSDSAKKLLNLLQNININYHKNLAAIGIIKMETDLNGLKSIKRINNNIDIQRDVDGKNLNYSMVFGTERSLYWNKDYYGPLVIPFKGYKIKLDPWTFLLYKNCIDHETKMKLEIRTEAFFINGKEIKTYTFKENHYFVLNDRRSDVSDSRTYGPVSEELLTGTFLFKLPW